MTATEQLRALFDELLEVPAEHWPAWLDRRVPDTVTRARLQALIEANDSAGHLLDTPMTCYAELLADDDNNAGKDELDPALITRSLLGCRFGAFRLVRLLGRGGMATVFLGQRENADFAQQAAVKILHRGLYSEAEQRLFRRERRILARLDHPDIARLIDGGVSAEGVPFLVLEYIDGVPITDYVRIHGLDARARLQLMLRLARAVEAAHRALVVHRDLKPGNVLVSKDGALKVLDFGIAKLVEDDEDGATEVARMTPGYAAPEQLIGGVITAATDVHALGILLRQLLTGRAPTRGPRVDGGADTVALLPPEVQRIIAMASAPEAGQRYPTAAAFADDIERYLDGRPVLAHPPSPWYYARKFVARHRGAVVVTIALVLGIFTSLGIAVWQARNAHQQAQQATAVRDFLVTSLDTAKASLPIDQKPSLDGLVNAAVARLEANGELDELTRAELLHTFAVVAASVHDHAAALRHLDRALAIRQRLLSPDHPDLLLSQVRRAENLEAIGRSLDADAILGAQLANLRASESEAGVAGLLQAASARDRAGEPAQQLALVREAADKAQRLFGPQARLTLAVRLQLADALASAGHLRESAREAEAAIALWHAAGIPVDSDLAGSMSNLQDVRERLGESADILERREALLAIARRIHSDDHPRVALALKKVADERVSRGHYDQAAVLYADALQMSLRLHGDSHPDVLMLLDEIALNDSLRGEYTVAESRIRHVLRRCHRDDPRLRSLCVRSQSTLGLVLSLAGRAPEAQLELSQALEQTLKLPGNTALEQAILRRRLANNLLALGRPQEALAQADQALAGIGSVAAQSGSALAIRTVRAEALLDLGALHEAGNEIDNVLALMTEHHAQEAPALTRQWLVRAEIAERQGDLAAARRYADSAHALNAPGHSLPPRARATLARLTSGR